MSPFLRSLALIVVAASTGACSSSDTGSADGSGGAGGAGGTDASTDGAPDGDVFSPHALCVAAAAAACPKVVISSIADCEAMFESMADCAAAKSCVACAGASPAVQCDSGGGLVVVGCESQCGIDSCKDGGSGGNGGGPPPDGAAGGPDDGGGNDAGSGGAGGAPPGTPGKIACGGTDCNVTAEHCCDVGGNRWCEAQAGTCQSDAGQADSGSSTVTIKACDDSADCTGGAMCCAQMSGAVVQIACLGPLSPPWSCPLYEACVSNGQCLTGKTACTPEGVCQVPNPQPTCGSFTCPVSASICCQTNADASIPGCTDSAGCGPDDLAMRCTQSSDCGTGEHCCRGSNGAWCHGQCLTGTEAAVCTSDADCGATGLTCQPDLVAPSVLKICR